MPIGDKGFYQCCKLKSFDVESNNLNYASKDGIRFTKNFEILICFPSNLQFTTYKIPTSVTSIGNSGFSQCYNRQSVTILTSVASIGDSAFSQCSNLESITIPTSVISIGNAAFSNCSNLESITILTSVTSFGDSAFYYCPIIRSIFISDLFRSQIQRIFPSITKLSKISFIPNK